MDARSKKNFFQKIALDENGNIIVSVEDKEGDAVKGVSQYETMKKLKMNDDGHLKIYE